MRKLRWLTLPIMLAALVLSVTLLKQNTLAVLCIGMTAVLLTVFSLFEKKHVATEKIVLIALLAAVASVGRILFSSIASVQPASFIIMMTGVVFGSEMGFLTGSVTALASNLVLGQGPWTIWQMMCWGLMGAVSALLHRLLCRYRLVFMGYGLVWGFLFGWIMNAWFVLAGYGDGVFSISSLVAAGLASFPMDLAHGVTNSILILLFYTPFMKILGRISVKYGLAEFSQRKETT